jgi:two-component system, NarL family, nitrate/nitrite response regulator NarL
MTISILVATDSPILRDGLCSIIKGTEDLKLAGATENHGDIISRARELCPNLVILDASFASESLLSVIDTIVGQNSKVLLIGGEMDNAQIIEALFRGANGVIGRKSTPDLVRRSIRAVVSGEFWVSRQVTTKLVEVLRTEAQTDGGGSTVVRALKANRPPGVVPGGNNFGLTKRELQVISALVEGQSNKDIAATFGVSEYTVKHHLTNVFDKLGVYNRLELVLFAIRNQLCSATDEADALVASPSNTGSTNTGSTKKSSRNR